MFSAGSLSRSFPLRRWGVPAIFLVAVAARLYGLTYHSLWFDEVMSTFWAARPAAEIWRVGVSLIQDKHPPLYYLALHAWTVLFGSGDVAVRTLGVIIGALAVLPAYGIGKTLGNARWHAWCTPPCTEPLSDLVQPGSAHVHGRRRRWD